MPMVKKKIEEWMRRFVVCADWRMVWRVREEMRKEEKERTDLGGRRWRLGRLRVLNDCRGG